MLAGSADMARGRPDVSTVAMTGEAHTQALYDVMLIPWQGHPSTQHQNGVRPEGLE